MTDQDGVNGPEDGPEDNAEDSAEERDDALLPAGVPGFDDPAYDDLRALLAEVRAVEPIPAEVATRLDRKLDSLRQQRVAVGSASRGRAARRMLAAAAAIVVVCGGGIGIARVVQDAGGSDDASTASADSGDKAGGLESVPGSVLSPEDRDDLGYAWKGRLSLNSEDFANERKLVQSLRAPAATKALGGEVLDSAAAPPPTELTGEPSVPGLDENTDCTPEVPGATSHEIEYEGRRAALVVHEPVDGKQLVEVRSCDGTQVLQSTVVDAEPAP